MVAAWAQAVVDANPGTYIEISRSGEGLHIFGRLDEAAGRNFRDGERAIEFYSTGRYIALTGNRFGSAPLRLAACACQRCNRAPVAHLASPEGTMTDTTKPPTPRALKAAGKKLWQETVKVYDLRQDELEVLRAACAEADLIAKMAAELDGEPLTTSGSMGQTVAHPLLSEFRQHRATLRRAPRPPQAARNRRHCRGSPEPEPLGGELAMGTALWRERVTPPPS